MSDEESPLVLVCDHVIALEREVDLVVHHADGMWSLMCGRYDHAPDGVGVRPVHLHHIIDCAPDLGEVMARTPPGRLSQRTDGSWTVEAHDD